MKLPHALAPLRGPLVGPWMVVAVLCAGLSGCSTPGGSPGQRPGGWAAEKPPARQAPEGADGPPAGPAPDLSGLANAQPRVEPIRSGGPNKPYEVLGQSYVPLVGDAPLVERGLASWYGNKFHGRRTASGETYNMLAMTAAHKTMPIPSYARVRNPANGREIVVRVNDRGPFSRDRIIDLSYAAAVKLGLEGGVAPVEVERITHDEIRAGVGLPQADPAADPIALAAVQGGWLGGTADLNEAAAPQPQRAAPASTAAPARPLPRSAVQPAVAAASGVGPPRPAERPLQAAAASAGTPALSATPAGVRPAAIAAAPIAPVAEPAQPSPLEGAREAVAGAAQAAAPAPAPTAVVAARAMPGAELPGTAPERGRAFTPAASGFWLQLGAFARGDGAYTFQQRVAQELAWLSPWLTVFAEGRLHRLQAGPYASRDQAREVAEKVRSSLQLVPVIVERR